MFQHDHSKSVNSFPKVTRFNINVKKSNRSENVEVYLGICSTDCMVTQSRRVVYDGLLPCQNQCMVPGGGGGHTLISIHMPGWCLYVRHGGLPSSAMAIPPGVPLFRSDSYLHLVQGPTLMA